MTRDIYNLLTYAINAPRMREPIIRLIEDSLAAEGKEIPKLYATALADFRQRTRSDRLALVREFLEERL